MKHILTSIKAKKILRDNMVRNHKLSAKQKRFFGMIAGGGIPRKLKKVVKKIRKTKKRSLKKRYK